MTATRSVRVWRAVAITLIVLIVLFVAADRIGDYLAEKQAAKTIQSSQNLPSRPSVDIAGFPFLTQLAAEHFDKITITAKDVPVGDSGHLLQLATLQVVLHSIDVSRNFHRVHADNATATATASYAALSQALGLTVRYAGNGRIAASKDVTVAGQTVPARVSTRPELANGAVTFTGTTVDNLGQLGGSAGSSLDGLFAINLPLQNVPFHVRATGLQVDASGVHLDLAGSDLVYGH